MYEEEEEEEEWRKGQRIIWKREIIDGGREGPRKNEKGHGKGKVYMKGKQ